jgi:hypothetical protein
MKTRTFLLVLAVALTPLAGCDHDGREVVESGRDAQGRATVHVDGEEAQRELDQAGAEKVGASLERGAERAGAALERGA